MRVGYGQNYSGIDLYFRFTEKCHHSNDRSHDTGDADCSDTDLLSNIYIATGDAMADQWRRVRDPDDPAAIYFPGGAFTLRNSTSPSATADIAFTPSTASNSNLPPARMVSIFTA